MHHVAQKSRTTIFPPRVREEIVVPSARLIVNGNGRSLTSWLGTTSGTKRGPANAPAIAAMMTIVVNAQAFARSRASATPVVTNTNVKIGKRMKGLFRPEKNWSAVISSGVFVKTTVSHDGSAFLEPRQ